MKKSILFSLLFAVVFIVAGCGGGSGASGSGGGGGSTVRETWSGSDSYGPLAFTIYNDGTFQARGTIIGGYGRSGYGTYSQNGSAITGSFSTSSGCTGPFSATVSGSSISGSYNDNCGNASGFSASVATVQAYNWQSDGNGFEQFILNDPQYYGYHFTYTFSPTTPMSTVTARIKKMSGSSHFGIIFRRQDENNFYMLSTLVNRSYAVYARVGGAFSMIIPWTTSSNLNPGYGIENLVSVEETSLHNFSIYFNGTFITSFTDSNFTGGENGFYASAADQSHEYFPGLPVDVRFRMSSPVSFP